MLKVPFVRWFTHCDLMFIYQFKYQTWETAYVTHRAYLGGVQLKHRTHTHIAFQQKAVQRGMEYLKLKRQAGRA